MCRQGQEQRIAALQIHPLEGFRVAGLAIRYADLADLAGLAGALHREILPSLRLEAIRAPPRSTTRNAVARSASRIDLRRLPAKVRRLPFERLSNSM